MPKTRVWPAYRLRLPGRSPKLAARGRFRVRTLPLRTHQDLLTRYAGRGRADERPGRSS
jgi:hypothetical protein